MTSQEDKIEWLKNGFGRLVCRIPVVVYCGESIFEYEYLREYDAKIGPQNVLLGIKKTQKIGFARLSLEGLKSAKIVLLTSLFFTWKKQRPQYLQFIFLCLMQCKVKSKLIKWAI